jgi:ATP-dependent RNA helicase RhlE
MLEPLEIFPFCMSETISRQDAGFLQFSLNPQVQRGLDAAGFTKPRTIQSQTIPAALAGRDVMGLAQTGTGKTAAFVVPILERLLTLRRPGPRALIVAPTRELVTQIHAELKLLAKFAGLKAVTIYGGVPIQSQMRELRGRPDIIVACPGRLLDLHERGAIKFEGIEVLVLDEADHMFDMGFLPDVRRIVAALPAKRQSLLFSATMPPAVRSLANGLLQDPHVVELVNSMPPATIEHALYPVAADRKFDLLRHLLADEGIKSAIVFSRTKHRARRLAEQLSRCGHEAVALQGNMTQAQRDRAMDGFRKGRFDILVATDIAARGIDVDHISHVINYDMPATTDAYTHRIGRTGRSDRSGKAYTMFSSEDLPNVHAIERKLGSAISRRAAPGFDGPLGGTRAAPVRRRRMRSL